MSSSLSASNLANIVVHKVTKTDLTRCQIFHLKCTKSNFGWGSAPDLAGGAHSASPDPLAGFGEGEGRKGEGEERG